jgi:hypothetical protein
MEATLDRGWRKSSYSGNGGQCVEVAATDRVIVRDSKDSTGPMLRLNAAAWRRFTHRIKSDAGLPSDARA